LQRFYQKQKEEEKTFKKKKKKRDTLKRDVLPEDRKKIFKKKRWLTK